MEKVVDFALDLQELNLNGNKMVENMKTLMLEYHNRGDLDRNKTTNTILAFSDNSGCEFTGHNIRIISNLDDNNSETKPPSEV